MLLKDSWDKLEHPLNPRLVSALLHSNFKTMMPVQKSAIPLMLKNYDVLIEAQTGSGKTLAFVIPIIERLLTIEINQQHRFKPQFVVLSPTREIAQQSYNLLCLLISHIDDSLLKYFICTTGGTVTLEENLRMIREDLEETGFLVWFGTVGRIREILADEASQKDHWIKNMTNKIGYFYIDEGDRVLAEKGISDVVSRIPSMIRTAVFSATLKHVDQKQLKMFKLRNIVKVMLKTTQKQNEEFVDTSIPQSLNNLYSIFPQRSDKIFWTINYINDHREQKIIIFLNTCASVQYYHKLFSGLRCLNGVHLEGVHGQLKPKKREKVFKSFFALKAGVLITTDVGARGIDFENIDLIIQIDPPEVPEQLVHRIGRTARVNREGTALLMLEEHESDFLEFIKAKGIPTQESPFEQILNKDEIMSQIVECLKTDRDIIEKSRRAFVSFMRSYKQHQLKFIFQFNKLNIGRVGNSFFLIHLPKIRETFGGGNTRDFLPLDIDLEAITWKNQNQKSQHDEKIKKRQAEDEKSTFKTAKRDIKNIKSERKKLKRKRDQSLVDQFRREEKQIRKLRKQGKRVDEDLDDLSQNTEEIERRILEEL